MEYALQILEEKLKELQDSRKKFRKTKRRNRKRGDWMYKIIARWYKEDGTKIVSIKKAIKRLKNDKKNVLG